ncbi:MAG: hypothetical protein ACE5HE_04555 [Phycisphaerae bacterium]
MSAIISAASIQGSTSLTLEVVKPSTAGVSSAAPAADRADFSRLGRALARAVEQSSLRIARTRAIRAEIEEGTYETVERLDKTVERVLDVIG